MNKGQILIGKKEVPNKFYTFAIVAGNEYVVRDYRASDNVVCVLGIFQDGKGKAWDHTSQLWVAAEGFDLAPEPKGWDVP